MTSPAPRLIARPARHALHESHLSSLLLVPHTGNEDAITHSWREAVCGPSLVMLALSALSNTGKNGDHPNARPLAVIAATPACVDVRLCFDKTRFPCGPIELALEIENCASHPVALSFGSGQSFDFCARRPGEVVPFWRWASGRRFAQQLRALRLDSGSVLRFEAQRPDAPAGVWQIEGKLTANGGFDARRVEVEIEE